MHNAGEIYRAFYKGFTGIHKKVTQNRIKFAHIKQML